MVASMAPAGAVRGLTVNEKGRSQVMNVGNVEALRVRGGDLMAQGEGEKAIRCRREIVDKCPDVLQYRAELIRDLATLGRTEEALRQGDDPAHADAFRIAAGDLSAQGKATEALACRRRAAELQPANALARIELVRALLALGRRAEAIEEAGLTDLRGVEPGEPIKYHDFTAMEKAVFIEVRDIVIAKPEAVVSLLRAVSYIIDNDIPGALVECGVFKGGNIVAMLRALLAKGRVDRDIYLFDTFEGMPFPEEVDVFYTGEKAVDEWKAKRRPDGSSDWVNSSLEETRANVATIKEYPADRLLFVKGLVEDTLPSQAPQQIALLRLDTDFYRSTKHELMHLYPRLVPGGVLIIDDYGAFSGARKATDEYFRGQGIPIFLARVDEHVRIAVKPLIEPRLK